jgi:hypothetical protein
MRLQKRVERSTGSEAKEPKPLFMSLYSSVSPDPSQKGKWLLYNAAIDRKRRSGPLSENGRNVGVVCHPSPRVGANPPDHVEDCLIVSREIAAEDWLMVGDAVAQVAQARQRAMGIDPPPPRIWESAM